MVNFSFKSRGASLVKLSEKKFDLLIVGGGVTGAGVARDAAMKGLSVALIEKNDFASGTSSASSKLVHGGLRYLENLEFGLVSEALHERHNLLQMAPHLVKPLEFLMPIYKGDRVGRFKMKMGMLLYDIFSLWKAPKLHRSVGKKEIFKSYNGIKSEGLTGGFIYSDALMDDDRLVLETLKSAVSEGAHVMSYMKAADLETSVSGVEVSCQDSLSGEVIKVSAKHLVSCVGPWTDELGGMVNKDWDNKMRPSKGVHITLPKDKLKLKTAVVMAADKDRRILFCIPRESFDIIGTTDTDYKSNLDEVHANSKDIEYILNILKEYYPGISISPDDVISTYAGVRPLVKDGSGSESKVSRSHWISTDEKHSVTYISGGKYTTFLAMAEECVDEVLSKKKELLNKSKKQVNTRVPFIMKRATAKEKALGESLVSHWGKVERESFFSRHGGRALRFLRENSAENLECIELEALIAINEFFCGSLKDFYFRRVPYVLSGSFLDSMSINKVAHVFSSELKISKEEMELQKESLIKELRKQEKWKTL